MLQFNFAKQAGYNPDGLIDGLIAQMQLKNDAALARVLRVHPSILCKVRARGTPVSPALVLRMHAVTAVPVSSLCSMMGVKLDG